MKNRIFFSLIGILLWIQAFSVNNAWRGTTNANWGTSTNWSQGAVPTASDGFVTTFDALSPNCTVNTSNRVCNNIDFTGYLNTITMTFTVTVSGNITFQATQSSRVSGVAALGQNLAGTITSNGGTWPTSFVFSINHTCTLADDMTLSSNMTLTNNITFSGAHNISCAQLNAQSTTTLSGNITCTLLNAQSTNTIINGAFTVTATAGITLQSNTVVLSGTTKIIATGGTITGGGANTASIRSDLDLQGNITISSSQIFYYGTGTLHYVSGTITTTGSTLQNVSATTTFNTDGVIWNNVVLNGTTTNTLTSNMRVDGLLSLGGTTLTTTINGLFNLTANGGVDFSAVTTGIVTGTTTLVLGGGTVTPMTSTGSVRMPVNVNSSGTVTFASGTLRSISNTWTNTAGTIVSTGSTLSISTVTMTNNYLFLFETLSIASNCTINGTNGFTVGTLSIASAGQTHTFQSTKTYTVNTSLVITGTAASNIVFVASTGASQVIFNVAQGATMDVGYANTTDFNSSGGQTVWDYKGTLSNDNNWSLLPTQPATISTTFTN